MKPANRSDRIGLGIFYYLIGVAFMGILDACAKWLTTSYSVPQIVFIEATTALFIASFIGLAKRNSVFRTQRLDLQILRGVLTIGTVYFFFSSLRFFPLADLVAVVSISPLLMTVLSIPILREKVRPSSICAVCVGFLGAILILKPGWEALRVTAILPVMSALCYALAAIVSRKLGESDPPWTTLAYSSLVLAVVSGGIMPFQWVGMAFGDVLIAVAMGVATACSIYYRVKACLFAPVNVLAPFDYTNLLWAGLLGLLIWQEVPGPHVWLGSAAIVFSGIAVTRAVAGVPRPVRSSQ